MGKAKQSEHEESKIQVEVVRAKNSGKMGGQKHPDEKSQVQAERLLIFYLYSL